jgi:hypothetical protein
MTEIEKIEKIIEKAEKLANNSIDRKKVEALSQEIDSIIKKPEPKKYFKRIL